MSNHEFVSSCSHMFDIEKQQEFWNVTLRRIKDYTEARVREAAGTEDAAERQSNVYKSRKQQNWERLRANRSRLLDYKQNLGS